MLLLMCILFFNTILQSGIIWKWSKNIRFKGNIKWYDKLYFIDIILPRQIFDYFLYAIDFRFWLR